MKKNKISVRQSKAIFYRAVKDCMVEMLDQPVGKTKERIKKFRKAIKDDEIAMHEDPYKIAYDFINPPDYSKPHDSQAIVNWLQTNEKTYRKIMARHYGRSVLKYI